jgi:hypothetical protein
MNSEFEKKSWKKGDIVGQTHKLNFAAMEQHINEYIVNMKIR